MPVGRVLLIVVSVVFLILGLGQGSDMYLVAAIAASMLAAIALIVRSRQAIGIVAVETDASFGELVDASVPGRVVYAEPGAADEPEAERMSPAEQALLATMTTEVRVVDGRPRYHLIGCAHLLSRSSDLLPVGEAIELGFTPCAACQPNVTLLQEVPGA